MSKPQHQKDMLHLIAIQEQNDRAVRRGESPDKEALSDAADAASKSNGRQYIDHYLDKKRQDELMDERAIPWKMEAWTNNIDNERTQTNA